jgi:hypothetical protein
MRASLMARVGSVAAAAVIATGGALATASAAGATTTHKLPTHLSIIKHRARVHHHVLTVIGGRLTSHRHDLRGKVVYLDRKVPGHKWVQVRHEVTNRHGAVAFVVSPKVEARYVLVFKGSPNFQPSHSRVVTVKPAK